ncbi:hypothetical protein ABID22_003246 [Pontibacter aydingkolensis]
MKDCCRTGDQEPAPKYKAWLKWLVFAAVGIIVTFITVNQINS